MVALLMRTLVLAVVAVVAMQATALFLYLFFGVPFARGFAVGAVLGIATAGLCGWLLWRLDEERGTVAPHRRRS